MNGYESLTRSSEEDIKKKEFIWKHIELNIVDCSKLWKHTENWATVERLLASMKILKDRYNTWRDDEEWLGKT